MAYCIDTLAKTTGCRSRAPIPDIGYAERTQRSVYGMPANSTSDGPCFDTGHVRCHIRAANRPSATIAEPAVATASHTSDGEEYTKASANSFANMKDKDNEEWGSDLCFHHQMPGLEPPYENSSHDSRGCRDHISNSSGGGRCLACCAACQYVGKA